MPAVLRDALQQSVHEIRAALDESRGAPALRQVGRVTRVGGGVARVRGLPGLRAEERVRLAGGATGIAFHLDPDEAGIVLLTPAAAVTADSLVHASGRLVDTPVGSALLGRVVDPDGRALDGGRALHGIERRPVEAEAPAIIDRAPVSVPLQTGIKAIDALIPIGRGQRELIIGDRQTGKTTIAVDTLLNQRAGDMVCVYCAIGQRGTAVARVIETLRHAGVLAHTIVVVAGGDDPPGLQYIAPFAATTMAEHFMRQGRDTLVVYDDLTRHARAYRELSLLLRRPPGREAYPGDIFYLHARLLERATRLSAAQGGGSLTALPIAELQAQDLAAYIPTNLISITDGQICLSPQLFRKGQLPAVDVGRSVSRGGGKAQLPAYRQVAGLLRLAYAQFEELETFARFASRLDDATRQRIGRGRRVRAALRQAAHAPLRPAAQVAILHAAASGLFDVLDPEQVALAEGGVIDALTAGQSALADRIDAGHRPGEADWRAIEVAARGAVEAFTARAAGPPPLP